MRTPASSTLALDVGTKRIGVAIASAEAGLARPLATLPNDAGFLEALRQIVLQEQVGTLVVGLPRGLEGQATAQTAYAEAFAGTLRAHLGLPVVFQDEAVTSAQAEAELRARGTRYNKEDIDALSATYILEDFLAEGA